MDPVASFAEARRTGELVKDEPLTQIWKADVEGIGLAWWKEYLVPRTLALTRPFARSRSSREWGALVAMEAAGLPVPQPLLFLEWRRWGSAESSLVVTRDIPDTIDLDRLLADPAVDATTRAAACESAGRLAARIHQAGFAHFRLVPRNILVRASPPHETWALDTPYSCQWVDRPPRPMRQYDLAQVCGRNGGMQSADAEHLLGGYAAEADEILDTGWLLAASRRRRKILRIALHTYSRVTGHSP